MRQWLLEGLIIRPLKSLIYKALKGLIYIYIYKAFGPEGLI